MIEEMEERRKWKHQSTEKARQEYRRLNNKLRRTTEEAREKWWDEKCQELEDLQQQGRYDKVYEKVKQISRKPGKGGGGIEVSDKQGRLLNETIEVKNRWKESSKGYTEIRANFSHAHLPITSSKHTAAMTPNFRHAHRPITSSKPTAA